MRIALIGGRDNQQFPTLGYGGIEHCVENLAWGLHRRGVDFVCIVPRRDPAETRDYPFEIVESEAPSVAGPLINVWPFARSLPELVQRLSVDVIWCQGFWAAETLQEMGIPILCTFHDILLADREEYPGWVAPRENTWYRFISRHQYRDWVDPSEPWLRTHSFQLYTGVSDEEFDFGPDTKRGDHFLWVGGLKWGLEGKGLDIFIRLAARHPEKRFIAYGAGNQTMHEELLRLNRKLPNFEFRGPLPRGEAHHRAFRGARLSILASRIPDTFPRTVVESITKGTPVLTSRNGALPEMIDEGVTGFAVDDFDRMEALLEHPFDHARCFAAARRFHIDLEIDGLITASARIIEGRGLGDLLSVSISREEGLSHAR